MDDQEKETIIELLRQVWLANPDLGLMELLYELYPRDPGIHSPVFGGIPYVSDKLLLKLLKQK